MVNAWQASFLRITATKVTLVLRSRVDHVQVAGHGHQGLLRLDMLLRLFEIQIPRMPKADPPRSQSWTSDESSAGSLTESHTSGSVKVTVTVHQLHCEYKT